MSAKKASTAQLKLVSSADSSAAAQLAVPRQPQPAEQASAQALPPVASPFERAFQAALRAERRIGDVLEVEWKLAGDDIAERLRLSAFALIAHEDPYAEHFLIEPWLVRFEQLQVITSVEEISSGCKDEIAFWRDAGCLASAQANKRATVLEFDRCIERVRQGAMPDKNVWLYLAILCVSEAHSRQQTATACALIEMVSAHERFKDSWPVLLARWHYEAGYGHYLAQSYKEALLAWSIADNLISQLSEGKQLFSQKKISLSQERTMDSLRVRIHVAIARLAIDNNDFDLARNTFASMKVEVSTCVAYARVLYHHIISRIALREERVLEAQHHLEIAREILRIEMRDPAYVPVVLSEYLQVLFAQQRWSDAVREADAYKPYFERLGLHYGELLRQIALTRMWAEAQGAESLEPFMSSLKNAMDLAVKHDFRALLRSVPSFASWICAKALEYGIQSEFARDVIKTRKLPTPHQAPRQWPWAVWLDLIGPFTITLDGQRLALTGKVAQKPLELIKLLACTKRYTLSLENAALQLWPDAEELGAARKNLEMTIARARKLIGDTAIKVGEGRVQLDAELVGCDLQCVLDTCAEAESLAQKNESASKLARAIELLGGLYEGELLQADEESLWLSSARQHLRNAYVRATLALATSLQRHSSDIDDVTRLLESAISREPLAEQLYSRLMQHYAEQGRNAEALHTYRRCKQSLSVISGLAPSRTTEALKQKLMYS
jgi:DNA-binding SARP family transcriptional activator